MEPVALIQAQVQRLRLDFRLFPVTASELEFYLEGSGEGASITEFWADVAAACAQEHIVIFNTSKESGREQYEIALAPCTDPIKTSQDTQRVTSLIAEVAQCHNLAANFAAKPAADQPGNGLHIHVHLTDTHGHNVFYKDDATISAALQHSIGGLLAWLPDCMAVFAPYKQSYARFCPKSNAPLTVSWGANNRTVAIRLPQAAHADKHIEHRVPGADADPARVMAVMLAAMHYGIKHNCDPGPQIFGDASLPMYNLPRLPLSLEEAQDRLYASSMLAEYFNISDLVPAH